MVKIIKTGGRLGNNIVQLYNAIYYCEKHSLNFVCHGFTHIKPFSLKFGVDSDVSGIFISKCPLLSSCSHDDIMDNRCRIVKDYIIPNLYESDSYAPDKDELVIHIRQGDIYNRIPHPLYVPNPLSYFMGIIKKFDRVLVVHEPGVGSPVLNELAGLTKVKLQSKSLLYDFYTLMNATNLVSGGFGTLVTCASVGSDSITDYYSTNLDYNNTQCYGVNHHNTNLSGYIPFNGWTNSVTQRELIMNYN